MNPTGYSTCRLLSIRHSREVCCRFNLFLPDNHPFKCIHTGPAICVSLGARFRCANSYTLALGCYILVYFTKRYQVVTLVHQPISKHARRPVIAIVIECCRVPTDAIPAIPIEVDEHSAHARSCILLRRRCNTHYVR
ncbi:hypothetical protein DENSPDRAFT_633547 [Dentipellis sp. KUC8613]|nr:hypothetical protein DENSPDRAFT_633547 [Dentipellis sp. KUC8613]